MRNTCNLDTFPEERRGRRDIAVITNERGEGDAHMLRTVSYPALTCLVLLWIGPAHAQSTAVMGGATQTTRGYGAQVPLQSLSKLSDPQQELAAAWVRDSSGERVGQVQ